MDNTSDPVYLQPAKIDPTWNPQGNIPTVFQDYQDNFLSQCTVTIAGFGAFSLSDIAEILEDITELQNEVEALQKQTVSGTSSIDTLNGITTVSVSPEMPSTDYMVILTLIDGGSAVSTNPPTVSLVPDSRTTTQFQFRSNNAPTSWSVLWKIIEN